MTQEDVEVFNRAKKMKKSTIPKELKPTIIKYSEKNSDDIKHIRKEIEMLHKQAMKIYNGCVFEVLSDPYTICGEEVVQMKCHETGKYFAGGYATVFLEKINP